MEKFMKKMWKKKEGFTLVELIVVIAILGILAGVAVPAYTGYMTKAKEASDNTQLDAIKTAVFATVAETGAPSTITVTANGSGSVTAVEVTSGTNLMNDADFKLFMTGSSTGTVSIVFKSDTYKSGAVWNSTGTNEGWNPKTN